MTVYIYSLIHKGNADCQDKGTVGHSGRIAWDYSKPFCPKCGERLPEHLEEVLCSPLIEPQIRL